MRHATRPLAVVDDLKMFENKMRLRVVIRDNTPPGDNSPYDKAYLTVISLNKRYCSIYDENFYQIKKLIFELVPPPDGSNELAQVASTGRRPADKRAFIGISSSKIEMILDGNILSIIFTANIL